MRSETFTLFAFTAFATAATIQQRQNWPNGFLNYVPMIEKIATPMKPAKIVNVQPQIRSTATRKQLRFGPFNLPAAKVSQDHSLVSRYVLCNVL